MSDMKVLPLFATPFGSTLLSVDTDKIERALIELEYQKINVPMSNGCSVSKSMDILDGESFQELKTQIQSAVINFSEQYIGSRPTQFQIQRSWATRAEPGQASAAHNHLNSMYSAVYYNQIEARRTAIRFFNFHSPRAYDLGKAQDTPYNLNSWTYFPQPKNLIIFPAYLHHTIVENMGSQVRYSVACNINPTGTYGIGDSEIKGGTL
jgi:uncharacterized protein (TIGR02466 family)